jgi:hypothetical protein
MLGAPAGAAAAPLDPFLGTWWAIDPTDGSLEQATFGADGSLFFRDDSAHTCGGVQAVLNDVGTVSGNTWTGSGAPSCVVPRSMKRGDRCSPSSSSTRTAHCQGSAPRCGRGRDPDHADSGLVRERQASGLAFAVAALRHAVRARSEGSAGDAGRRRHLRRYGCLRHTRNDVPQGVT